jgi:nucleoid-associated protein YgaU
LSELAEQNDKSSSVKKYKILAIILALILVLGISSMIYYHQNKQVGLQESILSAQNEIGQLRDSLVTLNALIIAQASELASADTDAFTSYQIVHNDSPWKIVQKFYGIRGDWKELAKKIAVDNNIWDNTNGQWKPIYPGQVIKIYNQ